MLLIDRRLNEISVRVKCNERLGISDHGSMCQQDFQFTRRPMNIGLDQSEKYGSRGMFSIGMVTLDSRQDMFAHVFCLRLRRDTFPIGEEVSDPWCCYQFDDYDLVLELWTENRNTYNAYGDSRMEYNVIFFI